MPESKVGVPVTPEFNLMMLSLISRLAVLMVVRVPETVRLPETAKSPEKFPVTP